MANIGYVESLWRGVDDAVKKSAKAAFEYVLKNVKFGPIENETRAGNLGGAWYQVTTSSVANQEFSFQHRLGAVPSLILMGALPVNVSGAETVNVTISTLADENRVYLKSATTGAVTFVYVESAGA